MVSIFICGDIVNYSHENGRICTDELANIISQADYSVCNFEAPIGGYGKPQPKSGPHHYQRKETIKGLKEQGFNHILLANNHTMDYGFEGLQATINEIEKQSLDYSGVGLSYQMAYKPFIKNINDLKIGIVNAAEAALLFGVHDYFKNDKAGHAWINNSLIDKTIIMLKQECDFVIILSHAGLEHYPIPQKEWRERYKHLCDLGADVVVGSHPHVPQGYEKYDDSLIFYSLGNFYFDSVRYIDKEDRSFSVWLDLDRGKPPKFKTVYHYKKNGLVNLAPIDKQVNLQKLCSLLGKKYSNIHDAMSLEAYEKIKRNLTLSLIPFPYDGKLKTSVRGLVSRLLGKRRKIDKTVLLLHLFKNEAYYYAAKHALEILARERHARK